MFSGALRVCLFVAAVAAVLPFSANVARGTEIGGTDVIPLAAFGDGTLLSAQDLALSGTGLSPRISPAVLASARIVGGLGLGTTSDTANNLQIVRQMFSGSGVKISIISINGHAE